MLVRLLMAAIMIIFFVVVMCKPKITGEFLTKTVKVVVGKDKPDDGKFIDETWFETGKRSYYYEANGPDIVKIDAEGGKVKDVAEIKKTEDSEYDYGREKLFDWVKGKNDKEVDEMLQKLIKRLQGGPQPLNTISGATETAVGNLSAIQNAIHRSKKYSKDNKEQNINYIDFVKRPSAAQFYGDSGKTFKLDDCARIERQHPGALHPGPLPGALAHLRLLQRRRHRPVHRLGRPHAPQPRPARGGPRAHHRPGVVKIALSRKVL